MAIAAVGAPMGSSAAPFATPVRPLDDDTLAERIAAGLCSRNPLEDTRLAGKYHIEVLADCDDDIERFDATRIADARWVTVEVPTADAAASVLRRDAFIRRAAAERTLVHRNVFAVLDVGVAPDGRPFLVREAADTEPLADLVARGETLPWTRVRQIALQLCAGVLAARVRGLGVRSLTLEGCRRVRQQRGVDNLKLGPFDLLEGESSTEHEDVAAIVVIIAELGEPIGRSGDAAANPAMPPELDALIGRTRGRAGDAEPCEGVLDLGRALLAIGGGATMWSRARCSVVAGVIEGDDADAISRAVAAEFASEPEVPETSGRERPSRTRVDAPPVAPTFAAPTFADAPTVALSPTKRDDDDVPVAVHPRRRVISAALIVAVAAAAVVTFRSAAPGLWDQAADTGLATYHSVRADVASSLMAMPSEAGVAEADVAEAGLGGAGAADAAAASRLETLDIAESDAVLGPSSIVARPMPDPTTPSPAAVPPGPRAERFADAPEPRSEGSETRRSEKSRPTKSRHRATVADVPDASASDGADAEPVAEPVGRAVDEMAPSGVPAETEPQALPASEAALPKPPDVVDLPS